MPRYLIYPLLTGAFATILIATVPKEEIRRLSIYGIVFGGILDILFLIFGGLTGLFGWINHGPLGYKGLNIFSSGAWGIFYILYFYFLPKKKPLNYVYMVAAIAFSILYTNLVIDLGVFTSPYSRFWIPLASFIVWFSIATWGFYWLNGYIEGPEREETRKETRKAKVRIKGKG